MAAKKQETANRVSLAKKTAVEHQGELKIIRASELDKNGVTGVVASGILESIKPNKFNPAVNDYFLRGDDGTLYIVNSTSSLREQLEQPGTLGLNIEIEYKGKKKTKKGASWHQFEAFVVSK